MDSSAAQAPRPPDPEVLRAQSPESQAKLWLDYARKAELAGALSSAVSGYMTAWKLQPQHLGLYEPLLQVLERSRQVNLLLPVLELGTQLFPEHLVSWVSLSRWRNDQGDFPGGRQAAQQALRLKADCFEAIGNLGNALRGLGDYAAAASCFEAMLEQQPQHPLARFNLACVKLAIGDTVTGLRNYESRLDLPGYERLRARNASPRWSGEPLAGKRLLVYAEQGLGDTFMMARYLPQLLKAGANAIAVEVQRPIAWILREQPNLVGIDLRERRSLDAPIPIETDFQLPMLSLMAWARGGQGNAATGSAYLKWPDLQAPRVQPLLDRLQAGGCLRVGIAWQGNPNAAIDRGRSLSLAQLRPLWDVPGVDWVSLQSRVGLEGVDALTQEFPHVHALPHLDEAGRAFEESLALLRELDLVVTSDSAIAHLAGALGKPCWLLLQRFPEWRWGLEHSTTPWYASARLFRQPTPGDWETVILQVAQALQQR